MRGCVKLLLALASHFYRTPSLLHFVWLLLSNLCRPSFWGPITDTCTVDRFRPQASGYGKAGANLGERGDSLRDRRKLQRGAQGALQAGHAALGKLHVRPGQ